MNTLDLEYILGHDPIVAKYFQGVYSSDNLPQDKQEGLKSFIVNTDPAYMPGTHWIALFMYHDTRTGQYVAEYFDSYGSTVPVTKNIQRFIDVNTDAVIKNTKELQSVFSDVCGAWCVYFLHNRHRGVSLTSIINRFTAATTQNDMRIKRWLYNTYGHLLLYNLESVNAARHYQCCQSQQTRTELKQIG
jgi:hypothetical protein